jgi:hypothetical protein
MGDQYVVMLDNKELTRGSFAVGGAGLSLPLTFSADGKHLFFMDASNGKYRIVVDGKMGPDSNYPMPLVISPDGSHYVYTGFVGGLGNGTPNWSFVDGRQVNYFGGDLQYTARNVLLSTMNVDNSTNVLCFNGKPELKAYRLTPMWISPDGLQIAMVLTTTATAPSVLTVNGKAVDGTQGLEIDNVYFSPNGKRYAALCTTKTHSRFMIIDGKKGEEYQNIFPTVNNGLLRQHWAFVAGGDPDALAKAQPQVPGFTPDSSKFVYVASQGSQQFMDVEDQESNGYQDSYAVQPVLSATGNRIAFYGVSADRKQHVIVDDKEVALPGGGLSNNTYQVNNLSFSPGGTRYAFVAGGTLYIDGTAQPGYLGGGTYLFSPDDQHFAYVASIANAQCLLVDGKIVDKTPGQMRYAFFTPDSQHFFFVKMANYQSQGTKDPQMLFADGQPVVHLTDNGVDGSFIYHFHYTGDALTFIGRTDGNLRRFTFTPTSNLSGMLASATVPTGN